VTIAREGEPIIFSALFVGFTLMSAGVAASITILQIIGAAGLFVAVVSFFFFREPEFSVEARDNEVLAPADGKVLTVDNQVPEGLARYHVRISIFLSIFDCHVNRIPSSGVVESAEFVPGRWFSAFKPEASLHNQRSEIELQTTSGRIHFRQIAGSVARRVVFDLQPGETVKAGQRFGVMRFGSRMDIFLPIDIVTRVSEGDRVKAGKTVIAEFC
jgi:phosphatidylserine decarboxylase